MNTEPVRLWALINAALLATLNVLALVFKWGPELLAGLNLAVGAWVAAIGEYVRSKVTPVQKL